MIYDKNHRERAVAHANAGEFVWLPSTVGKIAAQVREETEKALRAAFGQTVKPGKKAFRIPKVPGSRSDIDIAPALTTHFVTPSPFGGRGLGGPAMQRVEGIALFDTEGRLTINFPKQHHDAGKEKRRNTEMSFKKVVRQLKMMKDHLVAEGKLEAGTIPSFLVENIVVNVENDFFLGHRRRLDRLKAEVSRSYEQVSDPTWTASASEISGWKKLFGDHAPWSPEDCRRFLALSYAEVE